MALTSACAVGSLVAVTELAPSPTILPSRTIDCPERPALACGHVLRGQRDGAAQKLRVGLAGHLVVLRSAKKMQRQIQYGTRMHLARWRWHVDARAPH